MNRTELRMALRTLPFLDAHRTDPRRHVELASDPPKLLVWHPEVIEWLFRSDAELDHPGQVGLDEPLVRHELAAEDRLADPRHHVAQGRPNDCRQFCR